MKLTKKDFTSLIDLGYSVGPIKEISIVNGEKKVKFGYNYGHLKTGYAKDKEVQGWVDSGVEGIFINTGPLSGVVVVDIDEKDQSKYPYLKETPLRVKTPRSGGIHYYFRWSQKLDPLGLKVKVKGLKMDWRGRGGIVFIPPTQLGGSSYSFCGDADFKIARESLPELPKQVFEMLEEEEKNDYGDTSFLEVNKGSIVLPELSEGERNNRTTQVIGSLLSQVEPKLWEDIIWPRIASWNQEKVSPPQPIKDLRATWEQITKREITKRHQDFIPDQYKSSFTELLQEQLLQETKKKFYTNYKDIDEATGGLRYGNAYLVSGLEKSGKSSWLMNMLQKQLQVNEKMGFVNTELTVKDFAKRMTSYQHNIPKDKITNEQIEEWAKTYGEEFEYLGIETMQRNVEGVIEEVQGFIDKGVECLVFDNLTSWGNRMVEGRDAWQVISDMLDQIINLTQKNNIITFFVLHVRPSAVVKTNSKVSSKQIMEDPDIIFKKSTTYVSRPSLDSVYGGGAILSQISGAFFIWRPYQKIPEANLQKKTMIILESMRHSKDTDVPMDFNGNTGQFVPRDHYIINIQNED